MIYSAIWKERVVACASAKLGLFWPLPFLWLPEHPVLGYLHAKLRQLLCPGCGAAVAGVAANGGLVNASLRRVSLRVLWTVSSDCPQPWGAMGTGLRGFPELTRKDALPGLGCCSACLVPPFYCL